MQEYLDTGRGRSSRTFASFGDLEEPPGAADILATFAGAQRETHQQTDRETKIRPLIDHETYVHFLEWRLATADRQKEQKKKELERVKRLRDRVWIKKELFGTFKHKRLKGFFNLF